MLLGILPFLLIGCFFFFSTLCDSFCFCISGCFALPAVFVGWNSVVGFCEIQWYNFLDILVWNTSVALLLFVWALLLNMGFMCWLLICRWFLPYSQFTDSRISHLVLYAVVQVLVNKAVSPDNETYTSKKNAYPISNLNHN